MINLQDINKFKQKLLEHRVYIESMLELLRQTYVTAEGKVNKLEVQPPEDYDRALKYGLSNALSSWIVSVNFILNKLSNNDLENLNFDLSFIDKAKSIDSKHIFKTKSINKEAIIDLYYVREYLFYININLNSEQIKNQININNPRPLSDWINPPYQIHNVNPTAEQIAKVINFLHAKKAKQCGQIVTTSQRIVSLLKILPLTILLYFAGYLPNRLTATSLSSNLKQSWSIHMIRLMRVYLILQNKTSENTSMPDNGYIFILNHPSSCEDFALRALIDASCIAKQEVKNWWILGRIARTMGTIFTNRNGNAKPGEITDQMVSALNTGRNIGICPQGGCRITTRDVVINKRGEVVDLFSGAFDAAFKSEKPIVVGYWNYNPFESFAWIGRESLVKNIKDIMSSDTPTAVLEILEVIDVKKFIAKYKAKLVTPINSNDSESLIKDELMKKVRRIYMSREQGYNAFTGIDSLQVAPMDKSDKKSSILNLELTD